MNTQELKTLLEEFRKLPKETEWVEFKEAKKTYDFTKLGKYFSALSNEANLKHKKSGWLVFGVEDKHRNIVGTNFRSNRGDLDSLKSEVAAKTTGQITFVEIYELVLPEGRVVMFQIPPAPIGIPVAWDGFYYGRNDEELSPLNIQEIETIRGQVTEEDWSAKICEGATLSDLDEKAIKFAREKFKQKNPHLADSVDSWSKEVFLDKARVTIAGKITNTAILLLGKPESEHFLSPAEGKISWILKDEKNKDKDYDHFSPPFLLRVDEVFGKIRNLKYRFTQEGTLFPTETTMYEEWVIREVLHNCIAHQDYQKNGKIIVVEKPSELTFTNLGSFLPENVERFVIEDRVPEKYRNRFLVTAMVNLNMIDTIGSGIKRIFTMQRERFFPLPDYDLTDKGKVVVKIYGQIIDVNYSQLLASKTDLTLSTIILLDKVQKKIKISSGDAKELKKRKLVEGRYPNIFVSASIAQLTDTKSTYTKNKGLDKAYYITLISEFLHQHKQATRKDIDTLLLDKLPDILNKKQKLVKINHLLTELSSGKAKKIQNIGNRRKSIWKLL